MTQTGSFQSFLIKRPIKEEWVLSRLLTIWYHIVQYKNNL